MSAPSSMCPPSSCASAWHLGEVGQSSMSARAPSVSLRPVGERAVPTVRERLTVSVNQGLVGARVHAVRKREGLASSVTP